MLVTTYMFAPGIWEDHKVLTIPLLTKGEELTFEDFEDIGSGVFVVSQTLHYLTPKGYHQKVAIRPFKGPRSNLAPLSTIPNKEAK